MGRRKKSNKSKFEIFGIILIAGGLFALASLAGLSTGQSGEFIAKMLRYGFGLGAWMVALFMVLAGFLHIKSHRKIVLSGRFWGLFTVYVSMLGLIHHIFVPVNAELLPDQLQKGGGLLGGFSVFLLRKIFGVDGTLIVLITAAIAGMVIAKIWSVHNALKIAEEKTQKGLSVASNSLEHQFKEVTRRLAFYNQENDKRFDKPAKTVRPHPVTEIPNPPVGATEESIYESPAVASDFETMGGHDLESAAPNGISRITKDTAACETVEAEQPVNSGSTLQEEGQKTATAVIENYLMQRDSISSVQRDTIKDVSPDHRCEVKPQLIFSEHGKYNIPSITILNKSTTPYDEKLEREIKDRAEALEKVLSDFHVKAKVNNICRGPAVTRYELEPAPGVKVSKIVNLADDIALALASIGGVRIEAPIPGKAAIGIEVPNKIVSGVPLRDVLENDKFRSASSKLVVGLGKDIAGQVIMADLAKMPHILVAGSTGSGKSVCVNTLITSILFNASPEEVKFILVDPKVVELTSYNGIPHLLTPVVTDAKKAATALRWAVKEMERRYALFANESVKDITRYNEKVDKAKDENIIKEKLPLILIIIDELADLMMAAPVDVEDAICRLAQMARAAGLHMVLATQRPSVDVITGLIKANVPSRIAFAVSSQIDSRTILDMAGAEKLLGKGDMLYYPSGMAKPLRVQGAFIADSEVEKLLEFIKSQYSEEDCQYNEEVTNIDTNSAEIGKESITDQLLEQAIQLIMETGQASASTLQRRFRIGYNRAGRLIDAMEEMGIIGPNMGSKPREIIMTSNEVYAKYLKRDNSAS